MQQEPSANPAEILNAIQHVRPGNNFQPEFTLFARADVNGQNRLSVYSWALVSGNTIIMAEKFPQKDNIDKLLQFCSVLLSKSKSCYGLCPLHHPPPTVTFLAVSQLPVVRSEHVRTLFDSTRSKNYLDRT